MTRPPVIVTIPGLIGNLKWQLDFTDLLKKVPPRASVSAGVQEQEVDLR